jgi:hypothetical protein
MPEQLIQKQTGEKQEADKPETDMSWLDVECNSRDSQFSLRCGATMEYDSEKMVFVCPECENTKALI